MTRTTRLPLSMHRRAPDAARAEADDEEQQAEQGKTVILKPFGWRELPVRRDAVDLIDEQHARDHGPRKNVRDQEHGACEARPRECAGLAACRNEADQNITESA